MRRQKQETNLPFVKIDEARIHEHLDDVVRETVEQTLNWLLDAEADELCGAKRYARSPERLDTRAGHYERQLHTKAGEVSLQVPRLRNLPFETEIIERYRRRERSVEEALVEMYLAGVSVRRVEDITEALWGTRVSPSTVSELNQKIYAQIDAWRQPADRGRARLRVPGRHLAEAQLGRRGEERGGAGGHRRGRRTATARSWACCEGMKEDTESWRNFLRHLKGAWPARRAADHLRQVPGPGRSRGRVLPGGELAAVRGALVPQRVDRGAHGKVKEVAAMLKAIHAQEDRQAAQDKAAAVAEKLQAMRLGQAAESCVTASDETLAYMAFPREHWRSLRTNNPLERIMREIRRRTRVVGKFPDGESALMLVAARLRHMAAGRWGTRRYLDMGQLREEVVASAG